MGHMRPSRRLRLSWWSVGAIGCASICVVGEFIAEVLFGVFSALAGFVIGSIVFALVRVGRWALLGTDRATQVTDPHGVHWTVRIPLMPYPAKFWASQRLLRMRPIDRRRRVKKGVAADGVDPSELAHPSQLVDETDEGASVVAIGLLAVALIALSVLFLEAIFAMVVAIIVAVIRLVLGRWQCEVMAPDGRLKRVRANSLREARTQRSLITSSIAKGVDPVESLEVPR
jgi:hypothetical protein